MTFYNFYNQNCYLKRLKFNAIVSAIVCNEVFLDMFWSMRGVMG